jgi:hypothetical protein
MKLLNRIMFYFGYIPEIRLRVSEAYTQKVATDLREVVLFPHSFRAMEIITQVKFEQECEKVGFFGRHTSTEIVVLDTAKEQESIIPDSKNITRDM